MKQAICIMVEYTNPAEPPEKWDWPSLLHLPESSVQLIYIGDIIAPPTATTVDGLEDVRIAAEAIDAMSGVTS